MSYYLRTLGRHPMAPERCDCCFEAFKLGQCYVKDAQDHRGPTRFYCLSCMKKREPQLTSFHPRT